MMPTILDCDYSAKTAPGDRITASGLSYVAAILPNISVWRKGKSASSQA